MPENPDPANPEPEIPGGPAAPHSALGSTSSALLAAAGDAAALIAGAPIAGVADAAIGMGDAVTDHPAPTADAPTRVQSLTRWMMLGFLIAAVLLGLFESGLL